MPSPRPGQKGEPERRKPENKKSKPNKILLRGSNEMPERKDLLERELAIEEEHSQFMDTMEDLEKLSEETGMPITQENGQRTFGPPRDWVGPSPPKGSEVFVGKLPRSINETHLVPLFSKMGQIYELRLMLDFSGENRGFCFVQYTEPAYAQRAVRELNDYEIRKNRRIGVVKSMDNCRLFVGGIPTDKGEKDIFHEMNQVTGDVRRVIVYPSSVDKTKNRGFAFVEYESHKSAAMARRKMIPGNILLWNGGPNGGVEVCVDWAEPEPEVQNLYVRNLMLSTTEETLKALFNSVSNNGVEKVKKIKDFAFVHFLSREQADRARLALNNTEIDGSLVEVCWAKPPCSSHSKTSGNGSNSDDASVVSYSRHHNNHRHHHRVRNSQTSNSNAFRLGNGHGPLMEWNYRMNQPLFYNDCGSPFPSHDLVHYNGMSGISSPLLGPGIENYYYINSPVHMMAGTSPQNHMPVPFPTSNGMFHPMTKASRHRQQQHQGFYPITDPNYFSNQNPHGLDTQLADLTSNQLHI